MENGWAFVADSLRPSAVPLTHVFVTMFASWEPSILQDLWVDHQTPFVTDIFYRLRRHQELLKNDSYALTYTILEARDHLAKMSMTPFSAFDISNGCEDFPVFC